MRRETKKKSSELQSIPCSSTLACHGLCWGRIKRTTVRPGDSCFVMQPFARPHGDCYEKNFKPAIDKTGLKSVRADTDIFGTGKIIDLV